MQWLIWGYQTLANLKVNFQLTYSTIDTAAVAHEQDRNDNSIERALHAQAVLLVKTILPS